ncbi:Cytochrome P450 [Duganella sp. CF517]|uniref:cytochrome P450 n=1 Tax=Duganella sp. CF517 TaxID=1881038 RepID=UPI0008D02E3B|nr:cytochrome P450 [Duganella sp. CF517]SEO52481.1 Cytochrome P450 [Duganella sp. CF517]
MHPSNAVAAASHPDPYPYYRQLLAGPALYFDAGLRLWIASRAEIIRQVFDNPHCLVRPVAEPVPKAIAGGDAGAVFARLIRMNEGAAHAGPRRAIGQALAGLELAAVAAKTGRLATMLERRNSLADGAALTRWLFDLPTWVVADLLGVGDADLPRVASRVAEFVRCLSPLSTPQQLAEADTAARSLNRRFAELVRAGSAAPGTLLGEVARQAAETGWTGQEGMVANVIGLLSQTHEATAGLIGNCIVALLGQPGLQQRLRAAPGLATALVREVARFDPPVQNTRRFVARATSVAGVALQPGDVVLLVLAAAGRDERVHAQPDSLVLEREDRPLPGFGHGRHACPGHGLAFVIAATAIRHLLERPVALGRAELGWAYRPSANGRLPEFFNVGSEGRS